MVDASLRTIGRWTAGTAVVLLLLATAGLTLGYEPPQLGAGAVTQPADSRTIVGVQGYHFQAQANAKKPARLLTVDRLGRGRELLNGSARNASWFYDVDPLSNGNVLVTTTNPPNGGPPGGTIVYEYDPSADEVRWRQPFDAVDTHDVDKISEHELVVANMRNGGGNETVNADRLFVYNLTTDEVVWEWYFRNHYPNGTDAGIRSHDWSHVNDVDPMPGDRFLVSPRNFDQVIVVNRSTKAIEMRLGSDGNHSILAEQHNPDYLEGPDGTPTILVADSENDRIVEYERDCGNADPRLGAGTPPDECEWDLVWELGTERFNWPRDADRLPNGNTLVVDSLNHRVVEVTPRGEIVWETFTPWAPYDAERVKYGDSSTGPTMREQGVDGSFNVTYAGTNATAADGEASATQRVAAATGGFEEGTSFPQWLKRTTATWPFSGAFADFAEGWEGVSQWVKPVWMAPWGFVALVAALLIALPWSVLELVARRDRVVAGVRSAAGRARSAVD